MIAEGDKGNVGISKDVVAAIAGIAVSEVEGIASVRSGEAMKRHVDTEVEGESVKVTIRIAVLHGKPIHKIAKQVQTRVKTEIERMTGLRVSAVDVDVHRLVAQSEPVEDEEGDET
jgi:uncharacterized alkaline shock family protein YloU